MGEQADAPWDLYGEIHKAMRLATFGITTLAGSTDPYDDAAVGRLLDEWADVTLVLDGHHHHEDTYVDPLVRGFAPGLRDELEAGHVATDERLDALRVQADGLRSLPAGERGRALKRFHLDLSGLTAFYLDHLLFEEDQVMPLLNAAMTDDQLEAVTNEIRGAVPPPEMCIFIRYMVPAMTPAERVDMLGGMHQGAPPEIFELFRAAAEGCLPAADYQAVSTVAGFA